METNVILCNVVHGDISQELQFKHWNGRPNRPHNYEYAKKHPNVI